MNAFVTNISADGRLADDALPPANAGAHEEVIVFRSVFQNFGEAGVQAARGDLGGAGHELLDIMTLEREEAKFREELLLTQAVGKLGLRCVAHGNLPRLGLTSFHLYRG